MLDRAVAESVSGYSLQADMQIYHPFISHQHINNREKVPAIGFGA
jgi:hypothetical protein